MPMLIDVDLTGDWPNDLGAETPTEALVAAPAFCFISDGVANDHPIARQLTQAEWLEARRELASLQKTD